MEKNHINIRFEGAVSQHALDEIYLALDTFDTTSVVEGTVTVNGYLPMVCNTLEERFPNLHITREGNEYLSIDPKERGLYEQLKAFSSDGSGYLTQADANNIETKNINFNYAEEVNWNWVEFFPKIKEIPTSTANSTTRKITYNGNKIATRQSQSNVLEEVDFSGAKLNGYAAELLSPNPKLTSVRLDDIDLSSVTAFNVLMRYDFNLKSFSAKNLVFPKLHISNFFEQCYLLEEVDVSTWDVSKVTSISSMFTKCISLKEIDLSSWDCSSCTESRSLFSECSSLEKVKMPKSLSGDCAYYTFQLCSNLKEIDFNNINTGKSSDFARMFYGCFSLESLDLTFLDTSSAISMSNMLSSCHNLTTLDIRGWHTESIASTSTTLNNIFLDSPNIQTLIGGSQSLEECTFIGLKAQISLSATSIDRPSIRAVINGVVDLTGQTSQKITLGSKLLAKLTDEDRAIAAAKNWTLA